MFMPQEIYNLFLVMEPNAHCTKNGHPSAKLVNIIVKELGTHSLTRVMFS